MEIHDSGLYAAFKAKDNRFDGRFFVGISSTGIYCRPICKAKQAKEENCTFFQSAAEAEQAGFRPCLLCRPELAPGKSVADANVNLSYRAAKLLEETCTYKLSIQELAEQLGYTDRHLRRVFTAEYNVSPVQYLQTCRLHLAKQLLTDTNLTVLEIAMAAGFGSLRRFNAVFKEQYRLTPTQLRKKVIIKPTVDEITLSLSYRPPYRWNEILTFLKSRAIEGVEAVIDDKYMRTVRLKNIKNEKIEGWIKVSHNEEKESLNLTVSHSLLSVLPQVLARTKKMFDIYCHPEIIYQALKPMNKIIKDSCVLGTRLPGCFDSFEMSVRAILGQLITVKAAGTIAARIAKTYGHEIQTGINGLTHTFPSSEDIIALENIEESFGVLGVTSAKSRTILQLAEFVQTAELNLDFCVNPETEMKKLLAITGIGNWTAQYIAMRAMEWTDSFLETDAGVKKALSGYSAKELLSIAEEWRPWRSYAVINLWQTL